MSDRLPAPTGGPPHPAPPPERIRAILRHVTWNEPLALPDELEVRAIGSNLEVDLRGSQWEAGVAEIEMRAGLANITLRIPAHVRVVDLTRSVLGGVRADPGGACDPERVVRLTGQLILSNVTVVRE
jgi:hypothetical protein